MVTWFRWSFGIAAASLSLIMVASYWRNVYWGASKTTQFDVASGFIWVLYCRDADFQTFPPTLQKPSLPFALWAPMVEGSLREGMLHVKIPIWLPTVLFAVCGIALWLCRSQPKKSSTACKCGYDLQGNQSGVCSECGRAILNRVPTENSIRDGN